jgi:hypothetical protein
MAERSAEVLTPRRFSYGAVSVFILFMIVYVQIPAIYSYFETGNLVFRYHSNMFYGMEALVMHICFLSVSSIFVWLSLREACKPEQE